MITKEEFSAYEKVRQSGETNMFAVNVVEELSGLDRAKIMEIMKSYSELNEMYPEVRKEFEVDKYANEEEENTGEDEDEEDD